MINVDRRRRFTEVSVCVDESDGTWVRISLAGSGGRMTGIGRGCSI